MKKSGLLVAAALAVAIGATTWLAMDARNEVPLVNYALLDGRTQSSADFKGKVVLVNFWATSCSTCVKEMPQMVQTYEKYRERGLDVVAVAMEYDPPAYVASFAESRKLPFKVALDNTGAVARSFGEVRLTPTTYLINKRGEIVKRYVGEPDFAALHQLVEQLLAEA